LEWDAREKVEGQRRREVEDLIRLNISVDEAEVF